jgi:hypothetical protein
MVVGGFAVVDLITHVRTEKAKFFESQFALIDQARKAVAAGTATPEQVELAIREMPDPPEIVAEKQKSFFTKSKDFLFSGLKKEDQPIVSLVGDKAASAFAAAKSEAEEITERGKDILDSARKHTPKSTTEDAKKTNVTTPRSYFDSLAHGETPKPFDGPPRPDTASQATKSWWNFIGR